MGLGPLSAGGLVDQRGEIFVPVEEVSVHAGAADDDPPADAPIFAAELVDAREDRCPFGG